MTRLSLALFAATGAFLLTGAAQAKAPPDGIDVCGPAACAHLEFADAEQFWMLSHDGSDGRPAPGPFYLVRWHWAPGEDESAYLIPSALAIRWNAGNGHPSGWSGLEKEATELIARTAGRIEPYPIPRLTRVTVGGREAAEPQSYVQLLSGKRTFALVKGPWLRVRFESSTPSPWTDGSSIVRLSKRMPFVQIDGYTYRIPRSLAVKARKALSLG